LNEEAEMIMDGADSVTTLTQNSNRIPVSVAATDQPVEDNNPPSMDFIRIDLESLEVNLF